MADRGAARCERVIPTLAVGDVEAAIEWYQRVLGFEEAWRWGEPVVHAAVRWDDVVIHLSGTEPDPGSSWVYFVVSDVDAAYERAHREGAEIGHPPQNEAWEMREMPIRDLVGNSLVVASYQPATEPELPIEREAVDIRLEKRLLALLRDLAAHKGMDVGSLLEETLLHSFERLPDGEGVASPHTEADQDLIVELKDRHGIDYDVHASYRFSERPPED